MPSSVLHQALAVGISRGFLVAAGIAVVALVIVLVSIRLRREDLAAVTVPDDASGLSANDELEGSLK